MKKLFNTLSLRKWAFAAIIAELILSAHGYIIYFNTKSQLVSPLIPENIINRIAEPYFINSLFFLAALLISFICYALHKYLPSCMLAVASIAWFFLFPYLAN